MATPGYDGQVIGRDCDCDCEDFPCCGHGITQAEEKEIAQLAEKHGFSYDDVMQEVLQIVNEEMQDFNPDK